jgi:hypothetical protein
MNEMEDCIIGIPQLLQSINAVLDAECNTYEKAMDMYSYYYQRPELTMYTIEKELHRMDYTIRTMNDDNDDIYVTSDKQEIETLFYGNTICPLVL